MGTAAMAGTPSSIAAAVAAGASASAATAVASAATAIVDAIERAARPDQRRKGRLLIDLDVLIDLSWSAWEPQEREEHDDEHDEALAV